VEGIMVTDRVLTAVASLAVASALQCNPSTDKTPSSIAEVYQVGTLAVIEADSKIRIDRVVRSSLSDSSDVLFEKRDYRLVEHGRLLNSDEAATLRKKLLDPRTYTTVPWMCIFDPEFAFSLIHGTSTVYVVLGTECHQAVIHQGDSIAFSNLTEQASKELEVFCQELFHSPTE
jgi:hypothetical protein